MTPAFATIGDLIAAYRARETTPVAVAEAVFARIEAIDCELNAMVRLTRESAMEAAAASAARWANGTPTGALDGIPITVKDTLCVAGVPFRRGSRATPETPAAADAPAVARAREAGAVIVGITTTPEFGAGPLTISPLTGATRSPWDTAMNSGGSSGGAAASVAAGYVPAALGTDAGGSIRIPAGFCGVVGLKPTGGRVPAFPPSAAGALATPAAITRTVEDAALLLSIIAAPDPRDPDALPPVAPDWLDAQDAPVAGLKVALSTDLGYAARVEPEIVAAIRAAGAMIADLGVSLSEAHPDAADPIGAYNTLFQSGFGYALRAYDADQRTLVGEHLLATADKGAAVGLHAYLGAQDARRTLARAYEDFFRRFDLLVTPMLATTGVPATEWVPPAFADLPDPRAWTPFGYPVNLAMGTAITLPIALSSEGRPIGLQIIGPRFAEGRVLQLARAIEAARGPFPTPPAYPAG
ncbi:amidase family protein [Acuticoccus kandeliae]|uniref:amidase family protein n=1 Tax=Acuticoccus kandeliae TaxID=2073160 RepID=UPI000D3E3149|nr:amidase family protein [Acuticoccus kandeliae]